MPVPACGRERLRLRAGNSLGSRWHSGRPGRSCGTSATNYLVGMEFRYRKNGSRAARIAWSHRSLFKNQMSFILINDQWHLLSQNLLELCQPLIALLPKCFRRTFICPSINEYECLDRHEFAIRLLNEAAAYLCVGAQLFAPHTHTHTHTCLCIADFRCCCWYWLHT